MGSKRLKKILKSKEFKLSLLCATTFAFLLASGQSFAKYYEENYNNENASIAKYNIDVTFDYATIEMPTSIYNSDYGVYVYIATFLVDFTNCEISCNYNLSLKLGGEYSTDYDNPTSVSRTFFSLSNSNQTLKTFVENGTGNLVSATTTIANYTGDNSLTYKTNTTYYAYGVMNNGIVNYEWTSISNNNTSNFDLPYKTANPYEKHYYKVLYFVEINKNGAENSVFLGKLSGAQIL